MQFEWIGTISIKYQPLGEDSNASFLQHLPQVCQNEVSNSCAIQNELNHFWYMGSYNGKL